MSAATPVPISNRPKYVGASGRFEEATPINRPNSSKNNTIVKPNAINVIAVITQDNIVRSSIDHVLSQPRRLPCVASTANLGRLSSSDSTMAITHGGARPTLAQRAATAPPVASGPPDTTISMRRLRARPSLVALSATGCEEPKPATSIVDAATPWLIK